MDKETLAENQTLKQKGGVIYGDKCFHYPPLDWAGDGDCGLAEEKEE